MMRLKQTFSVASLSILPFRHKVSHSRMPQIDVLQVRKTMSQCHELHATAVRSVMHVPPSGIVSRLIGSGLQILYILGWVFGPCPCMYNFDGKGSSTKREIKKHDTEYGTIFPSFLYQKFQGRGLLRKVYRLVFLLVR